MTTRPELTGRPTPASTQQKVLSDQDIEDILNETLAEMDFKNEPAAPSLTNGPLLPPVHDDRHDQEEMLFQMLRDIQSGNFNEDDMESLIRQMIPENPIDQIRQAVQLYETNLPEFEKGLQRHIFMVEQSMQVNSDPDYEMIAIPDAVRGELKMFKTRMSLLTRDDQRALEQFQESFLQTRRHSTEAQALFDRLVQEKKAEYVTPNNSANDQQKAEIRIVLKQLGVEEHHIEAMVNHEECKIAMASVETAMLSTNKRLIELYAAFVAQASSEGLFLGFIDNLPIAEATELKVQCVAFLKKRLGL